MKKSSLFWLLIAAFPQSIAVQISWFGIYTFVNSYIVKGLGHSDEQWTAAALWLTGGMIVWPFICLEIASRIGRRATVTLSIAVTAVFYLAMTCARSLPAIHLLLGLVAFPVSTGTAVWLPMVAEVGREYPGRSLVLVQFIAAGMGALMLVTGGFLIAWFNYWQAFLFLGLLSACCAAVFHVVSGRLGSLHQDAAVVSFRHFTRQDLKGLLTVAYILLLVLGTGAEPYNYLTVNQLFPNLAWGSHGLSQTAVTQVVALGRLPALISLLLISRYIDRINAMAGYGLGIAVVGIFVIFMGRVQTSVMLIGMYAVYFLFQGGVWGSSIPAFNASVQPRVRDSAFAVMGVVSTITLFLTGVVHNRMIHAGIALPRLFVLCGLTAIAGGMLLACIAAILRRSGRDRATVAPGEAMPAPAPAD